MKRIENRTFDEERALYLLSDAEVENVTFAGPADGESALKETRNIRVGHTTFALRYPLWHCHGFTLSDSTMTDTCRAPIWYSSDGAITKTKIDGVKCLRECDRIKIEHSQITSPEFGWRCRHVKVSDTLLHSEYPFSGAEHLALSSFTLKGKYSFQYVKNLMIEDSELDTKDAFWHAENVMIKNSVIKGEYLAWYAKNITLIGCKIIGTQPFCYTENLKLVDCEMIDCDFAFEYSSVDADVKGNILSVKNPKSGRIVADSIGEIIRGDTAYDCDCEIIVRK